MQIFDYLSAANAVELRAAAPDQASVGTLTNEQITAALTRARLLYTSHVATM